MDLLKLEKLLKEYNQPGFRLKQIKKAVFQDSLSSFLEITNLPKDLREILDREIPILPFSIGKVIETKDGNSFKALLKLNDNNFLETVLISPKPGVWSVCASTQVGCLLNCEFCATGKSGFKRNLTSEEIGAQVLFWKQYLKKNNSKEYISNVVYMGMGEPFLNWEEVKKSLHDLISQEIFGFGSRSISVSTCGIPEGIEKMLVEFPQINLAISLHFANDKKRSTFMPINKKYDLNDLKKSLEDYFRDSKRKVFLEYVMLDKINDTEYDAKDLVNFIKSIRQNYLLHVNLIQYNETSGNFKPSPKNQIERFKKYLGDNHVSVTVRKSLGAEIQGACGQLAGK